jgi:hypothetical protein
MAETSSSAAKAAMAAMSGGEESRRRASRRRRASTPVAARKRSATVTSIEPIPTDGWSIALSRQSGTVTMKTTKDGSSAHCLTDVGSGRGIGRIR